MSLPEKNKNILVIRLSSFGDVLLASSVLKSIKDSYPKSKIHFVVKKVFSVMLENNPRIDQLYLYEDIQNDSSSIQENFDYIIDLQNNLRSKRLIKSLNYNKVLRYEKNRIARFFHVNFGYKGFNKNLESVPQKYLNAIRAEIADLKDADIEFYIQNKTFYKDEALDKTPYIVLAPGAAHFTKQWPVDYFISLIKQLKEKQPRFRFILLGGANEIDTANRIIADLPDVKSYVGKTSFDESASIISQAELVICNDSSIMHLAAALKKKVLSFFGSTSEVFGFYPYSTEHIVLEVDDLTCRPCSHIGRNSCPKHHFQCMRGISAELAFEKCDDLLEVNR